MASALQQPCEVCDDTNASIRCQECRRNTCEECDEILHLESNPFMAQVDASADIDRQIREANINIGSKTEIKVGSSTIVRMPSQGAPETMFSDSLSTRPAFSAQPAPNGKSGHVAAVATTQEPQAERPAAVQETIPHGHEQQSFPLTAQSSQQQTLTSHNAPKQLYQQHPSVGQHLPTRDSHVATQRAQPPSCSTPEARSNLSHAPAQHPVRHESASRFQSMPQQQTTSAQAPPPVSVKVTPVKQQPPLQGYAQVPTPALHPQSRTGASTPSQYGARSHAHSGAATPTVPAINSIQNYHATGGAIPVSRWPDRQVNSGAPQHAPQPAHAQHYRSTDEAPVPRTSVESKQAAYLQHMQVLEQHRAVEAHQRMTASTRHQQHYPYQGQPAVPTPAMHATSYTQMGHVTPSMRHTGHSTPSVGHAPATLGHHSLGHSTPSMPHGFTHLSSAGYHSVGSSTPAGGHALGHVTPSYTHGGSMPYGGGGSVSHVQDPRFRFPSQAIVAQAGPNVVTWPSQQMRHAHAPAYHPVVQQHHHALGRQTSEPLAARQYQSASYPAPAFVGRTHHEPKTPPQDRPTMVYSSVPRTPYAEPRSPATEHAGWGDGGYSAASAYATAPRAPTAVNVRPAYQTQPHQPHPPHVNVHSTPSTLVQVKQPSPVDEAEARVRNLIADTEKMLAGLSTYS